MFGCAIVILGYKVDRHFVYSCRCSAVVGTTETKYPFSGYNEFQALSRVQLQSVSALGSHTLSWGYDWRQLYGLSHSVPLAVREQAGHSLKSSIKV